MVLSVRVAMPEKLRFAVPIDVVPARKFTVPVGVFPETFGVTVVVSVTALPCITEAGLMASTEVVEVFDSVIVIVDGAEDELVRLLSPPYAAVT